MPMTREEALTEYLKDIEENRLPELRESLAGWEDGSMSLRRREPDGSWTEMGPGMAENDRRVIGTYEAIAKKLRSELGIS